MSTRARSVASLAFVASAAAACQEIPTLPVEYETERARIGDQFDHPLCRGDLDGIDATIRAIEARTGRRRKERIRISLYDGDDEIPCSGPFGCYFNEDDVIATQPFALEHELVHAVAPERYLPNKSWSEGLAEAYKGEGTRNHSVPLLNSERSSDLNPSAAPHFIRWIAEVRGLEPMRRIIAGEAIEVALGGSVSDLAAEYEAEAPFAYPDWEACPYPEVEQTAEGSWTEQFNFDCDTPGSRALIGSYGATQSRTVTLSKGRYNVLLSGNAEQLSIIGCQREVLPTEPAPDVIDEQINYWHGSNVLNEVQFSRTAPPRLLDPNVDHTLDLEDGVYQLEVSAFVDEPFVGSLSILRVEE